MKLKWNGNAGPSTTQELADEVEKEGRLTTGRTITTSGQRCLWGVIEDVCLDNGKRPVFRRDLSYTCWVTLCGFDCSTFDNDHFYGTPEERCQEFARRLRAIP